MIVMVGLMSRMGESMRFDMKSGATKCISEDIKINAMTVGKYSIVNTNEGYPLPDSHKLTVRVTPKFPFSFSRQLVFMFSFMREVIDGLISVEFLSFLEVNLVG